ncbi:MAG: alpha/beta hydrolase [Gemmatimonadota bacterium]|nr:alpha/beta hydrolase [Gemmatimonadota bacterium]
MRWREYQRLQRVAEVGDRFVSFVDQGSGDPVVLIHGIPTWGYLWHGLLPRLAETHRVLVPDLLGFGYSDKGDRFDRSIARQAEMLDLWMSTIGVERADVVAHDIGGGVALRLATLLPHRVRRLVLMNVVCYDSWPVEAMLQLGHPYVYRKTSASTLLAGLKQGLKMGFDSDAPAELLDGLLAPYSTEVGKLSLVRNAAALNTNLTTEITPLLPRIEAPTLILWGEGDKFQPVHYGERLAWDIPGARLSRVADARHFVMLDQPEAVGEQLARFLGGT